MSKHEKYLYSAILTAFSFTVSADQCLPTCQDWDTFCKTERQIIATKCRLGVPVKHEVCKALYIPDNYLIRGGGSLVDPLPCSSNR